MKPQILKINNYNNNALKFGVKKLENNIWENIYDNSEPIQLNYPFEFLVNILNENDEILKINEDINIECNLVKENKNLMILLVKRKDDFSFSIKLKTNDINFYLHLPKGDYQIEINSDNNLKFTIKLLENGLFQRNEVQNINNYALPNETFPSSFKISVFGFDTFLYSIENQFTKSIICLMNKDLIINEYLKLDLIEIKIQNQQECDFSFDIELRGCVNIYWKCQYTDDKCTANFKYDDKFFDSNQLFIRLLPSFKSLNFNIKTPFSDKISFGEKIISKLKIYNENSQSFQHVNPLNFKIFINKKLIENIKECFSLVNEDYFTLELDSSHYSNQYIKKNIIIYFIYGDNEKILIKDLNQEIIVKPIKSPYETQIQIPLGYKAGEIFSAYFAFRDTDILGYCFNDELNTNNYSMKITDNSLINYLCNKTEKVKFNETCNIYKISCDEKVVIKKGLLQLYILEQLNQIGSKEVYIDNNIIYPKSSTLKVVGQGTQTASIKAGEEIELILTGNDEYGNDIDFYDLANKINFNILIGDEIIDENTYYKKIKANSENTQLSIILIIYKASTYNINIKINEFDFTGYDGVEKIIVTAGDCSINYPSYNILKKDNRTNYEYYLGETINVEIHCKDYLGNDITQRGSESFIIKIKNNESEIPNNVEFSNQIYYSKFKIAEEGKYKISVLLNGNNYDKETEITLNKMECNSNEIMCMDKKCVKSISECDQTFMKNILGINYCENVNEPFKCNVNGEPKCVNDTKECDCPNQYQKCNGMCVPPSLNYCENPIKSNCKTLLLGNFPNYTNIKECNDGSCSIDNKCPNNITCPIGYIKCMNKCILLGSSCSIDSSSCLNEFKCWDGSCVDSLDKCPNRITCQNVNQYVCPDNSCVDEESKCYQPIQREKEKGEIFQCDDMTWVTDSKFCKKNPICDIGKHLCDNGKCEYECSERKCPLKKYLCSNGFCAENSEKCSSIMYCPQGYIRCENNSCAKNQKECKYNEGNNLITCPVNKPILCPDYSCVSESTGCNNIKFPICPPHIPYKCWNNECRKNIKDCPTQISCPEKYPVLCSDGTCQKANYYCIDKKIKEESSTSNLYRCYNGEERYSLLECPTHTSCGEGIIKCWNGACVNDISECLETPLTQCSNDNSMRCPDGTCRPDFKSCSTISVCPISTPVKCFDNSCRSNILACPKYHSCGNKVSCPDGTCASSYEFCNTLITCNNNRFKCFDNSCKERLNDCPIYPQCGDKILCPNGECMSNRQNCDFFQPCTGVTSIRCSDNTCSQKLSDCNTEISDSCPIGYIQCSNGECKISDTLCKSFSCPSNKPFYCPEGICVHDEKLCLNQKNGCTYDKPIRCNNGKCVSNDDDCKNETLICDEGKIQCIDGSCVDKGNECPILNGCSSDKPNKCLDGTCVNLNKESCSIPFCPINLPFKCPNGRCVSKLSLCFSEPSYFDRNDCGNDKIMCYNGICVPSIDYCYPIKQCENGYYKCSDGTCRQEQSLCPKGNNCPSSRPFYCGEGQCAINSDYCDLTCPIGYQKCNEDGICIVNTTNCTDIKTYDGCPDQMNRCPDGSCSNNCNINPACTIEKPYLCNNGKCSDNCKNDYEKCEEGKVNCPNNGLCVPEEDLYTKCLNEINCEIQTPFRCSNGKCVSNKNECPVHKYCSTEKNYLCADGSCVNINEENCLLLPPCGNNLHQCYQSGFCVKSISDCDNYSSFCPRSTPIKCPDGGCSSSIKQCKEVVPIKQCENNTEFYCVAQSKCVKSQRDCIGLTRVTGGKKKIRSLLIEEKETYFENGCPENKVSCYDGTCVSSYEECPILPSCQIGQYRCPNGGCNEKLENCINDSEIICDSNLEKCVDGLCRRNCSKVKYNGCKSSEYQCSNGLCVKNELECIGLSMCDNYEQPFRCINGKCVSDYNECPIIERLNNIMEFEYTFSSYDKVEFDFGFDENGILKGSLSIPGNAFNLKNNNDLYGKIKIEGVPGNLLRNHNIYPNNNSFIFNISSTIPGSDGVLSYENSILSPVFNISSNNIKGDFKIPGLIKIEHNYYINNELNCDFYCLAKLEGDFETGKWKCEERKKTNEQNTFLFNSIGIYAIILYPYRNISPNQNSENFIFKYMIQISLIILIVIILISFSIYIFIRIIRYRGKYKMSLQKISYLQQQKREYELMSTDVFGQTLGDNILGLVYTKNPSFMLNVEDNDSKSLEEDVEELQKQCNNVENQNLRLQKRIDEINEKFKLLNY